MILKSAAVLTALAVALVVAEQQQQFAEPKVLVAPGMEE